MVEVFKTNVQKTKQATALIVILSNRFANTTILFDLEDCDKILRVESHSINSAAIIEVVQAQGYHCEILN
ncbi:hypothetical protein [Flavobacterium phycosphaerae]|uniref:hypothetical protein n=1 Tax=Flavobacterium phycosphaerae TaxID=2697515 RepID=UPI00138AD0C3|nr:hypothetical protein [Flavobacterium phycosphaerae]